MGVGGIDLTESTKEKLLLFGGYAYTGSVIVNVILTSKEEPIYEQRFDIGLLARRLTARIGE